VFVVVSVLGWLLAMYETLPYASMLVTSLTGALLVMAGADVHLQVTRRPDAIGTWPQDRVCVSMPTVQGLHLLPRWGVSIPAAE
jgi:hypothetical protein